MKEIIIRQAKEDYPAKMDQSPAKAARWLIGEGMVQTSNEMSQATIAHKLARIPLKIALRKKHVCRGGVDIRQKSSGAGADERLGECRNESCR